MHDTALEITQVWGNFVLNVLHFRVPRPVFAGTTPDCVVRAPRELLPGDRFPLVAIEGGQLFVQFLERFDGALERDGERGSTSLRELAKNGAADPVQDGRFLVFRMPLESGCRVRFQFGGMTFVVQRVAPAVAVAGDLFKQLDYRFLGVFAAVLVTLFTGSLSLKLLAILGLLIPRAGGDDLLRTDNEMIRAAMQWKDPPPELRKREKDPAGNPEAGEGEKLRGEEGKRGLPDALKKIARGGIHKAKTDREIVDDAGLNRAIPGLTDLMEIFGGGIDGGRLADAAGGLERDPGDQKGRGIGIRGDKEGGGGHSLTPGLGRRGRALGRRGPGPGPGVFAPRRGESSIAIDEGDAVVIGQIDPSLVDAVVKRHLPRLQACYEQRLPARPGLEGKIVVHFVIESDGRVGVSKLKSSSMGDEDVESCIVERFAKILFPKLRGEGTVGVNYPLLFTTSGTSGR